MFMYIPQDISKYIQPIADRVARNLEIISKIFSTNHKSAYGIYD